MESAKWNLALAAVLGGLAFMKQRRAPEVELQLPLRDTKNNPDLQLESLKNKLTLEDVDWKNKGVLMRVDYNCPITDGKVTDPARINGTIDTLNYLLEAQRGVKYVALIAHLGRPGGNYKRDKYSLRPCAEVLKERFPHLAAEGKIVFLDDCVGPKVEHALANCQPGTLFLLENLRFHRAECGSTLDANKQKVKATAAEIQKFKDDLSRLGDVFVFEAFGAAHRKHASITGISIEPRVAGKLMQKEMDTYAKVLGDPQRPFIGILGGSKVSDKLKVIENMLDVVDELIIAGGMAYTFKKHCDGVKIGASLCEDDMAATVQRVLALAKEKKTTLHFPVDHVVANRFMNANKTGVTTDARGIPDGWLGLDVGPSTSKKIADIMARAKTVLWNGPLGVYEQGAFAAGTRSCMNDMVLATERGATCIIGGGDTGAASKVFYVGGKSVAEQVTHVSTGGGSSLVLMEGLELPAVGHLTDRK